MSILKSLAGLAITVLVLLPCAAAQETKTSKPAAKTEKAAPAKPAMKAMAAAPAKITLMPGLGNVHHPVNTKNPEAQKFFDQGMDFLFGFNHDEAVRSFQRAAELDPQMAMAWWGVAKGAGPNYNLPVDPEHEKQAFDAIQKAKMLAKGGPERERDYIEALALRFTDDPKADLHAFDSNYSNAMGALMKKYPDDLDAATFYAESIMDQNPWKLWHADGTPAPGTKDAVAALESVLKRDPYHIGANHFYIHAVEASRHPERALPSASRLGALAPAAGHLVHMPGHIYIRTGDHATSALINERAAAADEKYIAATHEQGFYPMLYYTHNLHFITMEDSLIGRYAQSLKAAEKVRAHVLPMTKAVPMADAFAPMPLYVMVRFNKWNEILGAKFATTGPISTGMWHYARAMALAETGKPDAALKELAELDKQAPEMGKIPTNPVGPGNAEKIPQIAKHIVESRLAEKAGDHSAAIEHLRAAVALQDAMDYTEPPDWFWPVRESLGGALLRAGLAPEAEKVFREDLESNARNPRSLFGLSESLKAQGRTYDADSVRRQFEELWKGADTKLSVDTL